MWNVPDIPTADRAIIVPDVKLAYLNLAGEAWRFLVRDLASGMTVNAAVDKINTDGFLNGRPMKLRIIGGHNVTLN